MNPISLKQVSIMGGGLLLAGNPEELIFSVHFDSRHLEPGGLFIAISGKARDGHEFLLQAASSGAKAAIISDPANIPAGMPADFGFILVNDTLRAFQKLSLAYRKNFSIPFIAVTGSNGKTTTKDIIAHLLAQKLPLYKTYKNFNNHLGVPYSLLQLEPSHEAAVLEVGMNHAGEIDLLAALVEPQISVITYIGEQHIEHFGSREKIALAKAELLPYTDPNGMVLLNGDNEYLRMVSHLYPGKILYYSLTGPADIWASNLVSDEKGTHFDVHFESGESFTVYLPLHGKHNVLNALPAIAIARYFDLTIEEITSALATVSVSGMRFEIIHPPTGEIVVNDAYNASPSSMEVSLTTYASLFPERKKVLVLADMLELGEESAAMHRYVGELANRLRESFALLVSIGERARQYYEAFEGEKLHFASKEEALPALLSLKTKEYAVLFKGSRGIKMETLIADFLESDTGPAVL